MLQAQGAHPLEPFFVEHCVDCHGPEKQKGDLRIDTLPLPGSDTGNADRWASILEVLETGEMPPEDEVQPGEKARAGAVRQIAEWMAEVSEPPIALRRLNRREYEHTLHDLLGIDAELADLLPEDSSIQGFDNVSDGLGISSVLMERYLEAADAAFEATIRRIPPLPAETRRSLPMEQKDNQSSVAEKKGGVIEREAAFVKFTPGWPPVRIDQAHPIEDGYYRCRIACFPHDPGDRVLAVALYAGPLFGSGKRRFQGVYDVTGSPAKPRVIEFEAFMKEGETLHIVPWIYPDHVTWRDKDEKRPGIAIAWAETHGPLNQDFPAESQIRLFGNTESISLTEGYPVWMRHRKNVKRHHVESTAPEADAERIIRTFVRRAFRRPVPLETADPFVKLTLDRLAAGRGFEDAVRSGVTAVLCAPQFLLLNREEEPDPFTLASRLSYFLWSSMPDQHALDLAAQGRLSDPAARKREIDRLLADPKSNRFVEHFTGQWLDLRDIEFTTPDKKLYPEFDPLLQESMVRETHAFFRHVLDENLSVQNFIDSDFAFLNERLARHYGIDGVKGHEKHRLVSLPEDSLRGGVMAQASVLKVTANGTTTSPVLRGVWLLENVFGRPAPPPPPGVPAVEPDIRGATNVRDQLARHREDDACNRCHQRIDPPGFALESFDPIGGERTWYRSLGEGKRISKREPYTIGPDVDPSGKLPGNLGFADFREFRDHLHADPEIITRTLATKLLVYASGRPLTAADRPSVEQVMQAARVNGFGLRNLIYAVVETDMFLRR